jgi:hypothetical protein
MRVGLRYAPFGGYGFERRTSVLMWPSRAPKPLQKKYSVSADAPREAERMALIAGQTDQCEEQLQWRAAQKFMC